DRYEVRGQSSSSLPIVAVLTFRGGYRRTHGYKRSRQYPSLLTGREPGRQQPVVNLSGDRKAIELRGGDEQTRIVGEPIRGNVDVAFGGRDDPVMAHPCDLCRIGVVKALREGHSRLKRDDSLIDIQENLL